MDNKQFINRSSGIGIYAVKSGLHHLPAHIKEYLDHTRYHHWQSDDRARSIHQDVDPYLLYVPENSQCSEIITLPTSIDGQTVAHLYVVVGAGATVTFKYEQCSYVSVTIHLERHAQLTWHHAHASLSDDGYAYIACYQQQESQLMFNGWYVRATHSSMFFVLCEPKAVAQVTLGMHAKEICDSWFKTTQIHQAAETHSSLTLKGLLASPSKSTHLGMIHIDADAHQSDAQLVSRYLLLNENAQAYSMPSLEVLTNEVTCSHGSSIGSFDDAQLFYLMSRAMSIEECYRLLTDAFFL